ncbi:Probable M18 family aminopeptidase 1 [Anaerococcus prevotii]|uniref:M18 family aminopeptidase n=1 Tax=Anaerococcus prevotii (strain ATCC 9321 / DSM 20548 / JCM 6508 / NCTC 11806 / PC1) TaxID=525919 RepID=C7RG40_ANAPD|nr:peptidase M18 aminopeptidase I [Anaerococcus prevotii DSM 20548]SUU94010.1 Probable M18 family aminopeptidase 1 [Anaerococcus prevotii]
MEYKRKNVWLNIDQAKKDELESLSTDYMDFMNKSKTERLAVKEIVRRAEEAGFRNIDEALDEGKLEAGDKVYAINRQKAVALFVIGSEDFEAGMNIVGSHLDSPRLDLKPIPLYESKNIAYLKTHYYGGIKKYHWINIPLALHGVVYNKDGEKIEVSIGEATDEPVFFISELLVHLSKDLNQKKAAEVIEGEQLNIMVGSIPLEDEKDNPVKKNILQILNDKYKIEEEDFLTAEFEVVPADKARLVGLDSSMIMAYGHDDKVCAYTSLRAILESENPRKTLVGLFVDKEEIGSVGATGMSSQFFENTVVELMNLAGGVNLVSFKRAMKNSKVLSADVTLAEDPNFLEATEENNTAKLGHGVCLTKYTGARGKGGSNDADAEFLQEVRLAFDKGEAIWQTGELGRIDQGGGGTIAYILAEYGMQVVDCGTPVISMHAPLELVSKADVYETYRAYKSFYENI